MMPYVARQRELPHMHPAAATQLMYHSVPSSPHHRQSQHPLNPRYQLHQDPMQSNRPLFRTQSSSSAVPTHHQTQENLLRRKTPSGTLPAAYDAAPMEWTTRPTKQILLPYQPPRNRSIRQQQLENVGPQFKTDESWDKSLTPAAGTLRLQGPDLGNGNSDMFSTSGWPLQTNTGGLGMDESLEPSVRQFLQQQQQMVPPIDPLWFSAQPSGFQAMYNPITPPTASCDELNGYLMGGGNFNPMPQDSTWHGQYTGWGTGQTTPSQLPQAVNNMKLNVPYAPQPQEIHSNIWPQQLPGRDMAAGAHFQQIMTPGINEPQSTFLPDPSLRPAQLEMLSGMVNPGQAHNRLSHPSREKVVAWAHRAYVELLASIQSQQRQGDSQGNGASSKAGIFPRPPNVQGSALRSHSTGMIPRAGSGEDGDRRKRARPNMGLTSNYPEVVTSSSHSVTNNGYPFPNPDLQANSTGASPYHGMNQNSSYEAQKPPMDCYSSTPLHRLSNNSQVNMASSHNLSAGTASHVVSNLTTKQVNATAQAMSALETLEHMCVESGWTWLEGMLLGGCLAYGLGDLNKALIWYMHILEVDDGHVEAMSNLAAALLALNKREKAEKYWRRAVKKRPSYFEAVEHLIGLLGGENRTREAVDIITFVETALKKPGLLSERNPSIGSMSSDGSHASNGSASAQIKFEYDENDHEYTFGPRYETTKKLQYGTSGFMIPGSDNGRMLALIHAKGNMLYTLGDNVGAAKAFEDAVLVAAGINNGGIATLINKILIVLKAAMDGVNVSELYPSPPQTPVLLTPDKAVQTARLVFPPDGQLPGLREVAQGVPQKAAISTTSNSLLSLAKIFQDGMSTGGTAGRWGACVKDILALYYLSLSLHPSPSTANNVGIMLASIQQSATAPNVSGSLPNIPGVAPGIGPGTGVGLALSYYYYGLNLDSRHAHLYTNLGSLLKDINQLPAAIKMYELAVACDDSFDIALANLANAVKDQGRISDAIGYYRRAVKANPEFSEAVCGLANALNSVCDWKGRGGVVKEGGNRDRWHVDESGMLRDARAVDVVSSGWMKRVVDIVEKQLLQGESWGRRVLMGDTMEKFVREIEYAQGGEWDGQRHQHLWNTVARWSGQPYEGAKIIRMIERASRRITWRWYQDKYMRRVIKPETEYLRPTVPSALSTPSAPTVLPFHTFTCPLSAKEVRLISERNGLRISCSTLRSAWLTPQVYQPPAPPAPCLKVGYVSSDFNNHPLAHLMQSVFGLHDQSRVKAYCYATTISDNSEHRKQIERESPVFYDAHSWGPDRLVQQIVNDGIHILINLNGFTRGARNEIFAARPAPIQMSFMGFAGTLGAEWCDYLYADTTAVPPSTLRPTRENVTVEDSIRGTSEADQDHWVYAENIIFSRYSFFCCDHRQSAPDSKLRRLNWDEETERRWDMRKSLFPYLRDDQIILGNFNQLYKIEPTTFRTWLRILAAVPNAVLWLLRFPDLGEVNLHQLAETWASPEVRSRIIFTDVAPKPQHISRAQVCDLFLDTPECNAHTTAADVLWSGTPLLTFPRHKHKMCSRIAASILRAAVPQTEDGKAVANSLIADSEEDYERRAIEFAHGLQYRGNRGQCTGKLMEARKILFTNRWTSELFNTKRWVRDLEDAYEEAWRRWVNGEGGDIDLKQIKPSY